MHRASFSCTVNNSKHKRQRKLPKRSRQNSSIPSNVFVIDLGNFRRSLWLLLLLLLLFLHLGLLLRLIFVSFFISSSLTFGCNNKAAYPTKTTIGNTWLDHKTLTVPRPAFFVHRSRCRPINHNALLRSEKRRRRRRRRRILGFAVVVNDFSFLPFYFISCGPAYRLRLHLRLIFVSFLVSSSLTFGTTNKVARPHPAFWFISRNEHTKFDEEEKGNKRKTNPTIGNTMLDHKLLTLSLVMLSSSSSSSSSLSLPSLSMISRFILSSSNEASVYCLL